LQGKLLLSCLQKKNPTKKQNRDCILFPAKLAITYFCSSSLATCWSSIVDARNLWQICTLEIGSCRHV
jgi:hypothetical protein